MSAHYSKPLARLGKCDSNAGFKMKYKNIILLLSIALFGFAIGFMACQWRTRSSFIKLLTAASQIQEGYAVETARTAAEDVYFTQTPEIALGAMLCYVKQLDTRREIPTSVMSPGYYSNQLHIVHGRLAKIYSKLDQEDKAKLHTEKALSFHPLSEEYMIWKVDLVDRNRIEERKKEANK